MTQKWAKKSLKLIFFVIKINQISRNNQSRNNSFTTLKWSIWHHEKNGSNSNKNTRKGRNMTNCIYEFSHSTHTLVTPHHHRRTHISHGYLCLFHKNANKILCARSLRYYSIFFIMQHTSEVGGGGGGGHIINWKALLSVIAFLCVFLFHLYRSRAMARVKGMLFVDNIKSKGKHHTVLW